jgi:hypothetical protein
VSDWRLSVVRGFRFQLLILVLVASQMAAVWGGTNDRRRQQRGRFGGRDPPFA